jgi:Na+/proline symporter
MASMSCLVFARTIQEYIVFLLGISCLVFGPMLALSKKQKRRECFFLGILTGIVSSLILWFFRTKVYKSGLPNTEGRLDTFFSVSGITWNIIMVLMYLYILK